MSSQDRSLVVIDPALKAQQSQVTEAELQPQALEWIMVCLGNNESLFREARGLIQSHHFYPNEEPLRLVYNAMCQVYDVAGRFDFESLATCAEQMLIGNPDTMLTEQQTQHVFRRDNQGLIYNIIYPSADVDVAGNLQWTRHLLQRFATERTVVAPLRRVINPGLHAGIPTELDSFLESIRHQQARISSLGALQTSETAPAVGSIIKPANVFLSTGLPWLDTSLGGHRQGDANGLLGPTGGGKTTLAVHMAVEQAHEAWSYAQRTNTVPGVVVLLTYEESKLKLQPKVWSAAAKIPREKLEIMDDWTTLTTQANLEAYERNMQGENQTDVLSEIERYQMAREWLNQCLIIVDMSGSDEAPQAGEGYVDEIVGVLTRQLEARGQWLYSTFIDYAGLVCERYMAAAGLDERNYRLLLKRFGNECRMRISEKFGTITWITHQLKGETGKASPINLMHHADAGESKDFATNLAVCMCLGTADPSTGCRRLNISKIRYRANEKIAPITLRIDSQFALMQDASNQFTVDEAGRQFVDRDTMNEIGGAGHAEQRREQVGPQGLSRTTSPATAATPDVDGL